MAKKLTGEDGEKALRGHVVSKALFAREKYGGSVGYPEILQMLEDPEVVRFSTHIRFDAEPLRSSEFGHATPLGESPQQGYALFIHPAFKDREDILPLLVAYHIVTVNYGDVATMEEAELFGSTLLGMGQDEYYEALCELADSLKCFDV